MSAGMASLWMIVDRTVGRINKPVFDVLIIMPKSYTSLISQHLLLLGSHKKNGFMSRGY